MAEFEFEKYTPQAESLWQKFKENNTYRMILGGVLGAIGGYLYWHFVGCNSGGCTITSSPYKTVGLFTIMGVFLFNKNRCGGAC